MRQVLRATVLQEVLDGYLDEDRTGVDRDRAVGSIEAPDRLSMDPTPLHAGAFRRDENPGTHRHRPTKIGLEVNSHGRLLQQPVNSAQRLVECRGQHAAVGQTWCSLVVLVDDELSRHHKPITRGDLQMQARGVIDAAAEAQVVVRGNGGAGSGRVGMTLRWCNRLCHDRDPTGRSEAVGERLTG